MTEGSSNDKAMMLKKEKFFWGALLVLVLVLFASIMMLLNVFKVKAGEKLPTVTIGSATWQVEIADSFLKQAQGLSGRKSLAEEAGMLFVFKKPDILRFWMKGMELPLDIVWIRDRQVVGVSENLLPITFRNFQTFSPPEPADKALEINAGQVKQFGIKAGDAVVLK